MRHLTFSGSASDENCLLQCHNGMRTRIPQFSALFTKIDRYVRLNIGKSILAVVPNYPLFRSEIGETNTYSNFSNEIFKIEEIMNNTANIRYTQRQMFIATPFDAAFVAELKSTSKSKKWDPRKKEWVVDIKERPAVLATS